MSRTLRLAALGAVAAVLLLVPAAAALADSTANNAGNLVSSWAKALILAVGGLVMIPIIAKAELSRGLVVIVLVIIAGGLVYAQPVVVDVIGSTWKAVK